jgi:hypothetical protein
MAGETKGGHNQSLIDDPVFISYLDDLDRGLRTNNRANDEEELPLEASDDPNFHASLDALDRGLSDHGASHEPAGSPAIVPQLLRHQPPPTAIPGAPLRAPAASSAPAPSPSETTAGGRPLLDLFPVESAKAARGVASPAAQTRTGQIRRGLSDAPIPQFSDEQVYDSDLSPDPTVDDDDWSESRAPLLKRVSFVAYVLVMMLLGASIGALVFHARVSRIIVQWQSVSSSAPPPTATHSNPD